jgi:hypothetical protein
VNNQSKQYAWKVISNRSKKRKESFTNTYGQSVYYHINRWTYPKKGFLSFLFVFKTRKDARNFLNLHHRDGYIYRCQIKNPTTKRRGFSHNGLDMNTDFFPRGTLFVDSVKLLYPER